MASVNGERGPRGHRVSALPSVRARMLAFAAIIVAGLCGGLIGSSAVKVGCHGSCTTPEGIGGVAGTVIAAAGVAVIAVLVLRAMGEWRTIREKREMDAMVAAASQALAGFPAFQAPDDLSELEAETAPATDPSNPAGADPRPPPDPARPSSGEGEDPNEAEG